MLSAPLFGGVVLVSESCECCRNVAIYGAIVAFCDLSNFF